MGIGLFNILNKYVATSLLVVIAATSYIYGDSALVDSLLPINGKPLAVFTMLGLVAVYEFTKSELKANKKARDEADAIMLEQIKKLSASVEVGHLTNSVNSMYARFIASGDEFVTNEYTIKELDQLAETRDRLGVNSFVEGRINYLKNRIKAVN